jgi:hypothetical protein
MMDPTQSEAKATADVWGDAALAYAYARIDMESLDEDYPESLLDFRTDVLTGATDRLLQLPAPTAAALIHKFAVYLAEDVADASIDRRRAIHEVLLADCYRCGVPSGIRPLSMAG